MNFKNKKFPSQIFRAYDIRGNIALLTPELVQAIAYGLVAQYQQAGLRPAGGFRHHLADREGAAHRNDRQIVQSRRN